MLPLFRQPGVAQDAAETPAVEEDATPEISREGWRERIQEARRRAKEVALERRAHPEIYAAPPEDREQIATERVLNDESLRRGDIVSTKKGLFMFRGRTDQQHRDEDFVALPAR
jgi:hypothetical protein